MDSSRVLVMEAGNVKEFDRFGRVGRMGRVDGNQKCPLIFFILCTQIDKVYIYLYTKKKLSPTFLWVSKFDVKLGVEVKIFKFEWVCDFSIFGSKLVIFFSFYF